MPAERYFTDTLLKANEIQEVKGSEFHHLVHVMRTQKGEIVELVNGKGTLAQAVVQEIMREKAILKIQNIKQEHEHPCRLILAQALPKPQRLDFILEKGTELGVDRFWLFPGHHSAKKEYYPSQQERSRGVTIAALKQCGRLYLPSIELQPSIDQWKTFTQSPIFFGDLDPQAPLFESAWKNLSSHSYPIIFVTGPEGGFSEQEIKALKECGAVGVKLHDHVLRTDTASLMALSLLSHWMLIRSQDR